MQLLCTYTGASDLFSGVREANIRQRLSGIFKALDFHLFRMGGLRYSTSESDFFALVEVEQVVKRLLTSLCKCPRADIAKEFIPSALRLMERYLTDVDGIEGFFFLQVSLLVLTLIHTCVIHDVYMTDRSPTGQGGRVALSQQTGQDEEPE
jgi:hypothetical protein